MFLTVLFYLIIDVSGESNFVGPFTPPWNDNPSLFTTWETWCANELNEGCYACENQDGAAKYCQASCAHCSEFDNKRCAWDEYKNCDTEGGNCDIGAVYSPRRWRSTFEEAKIECELEADCIGITRDNGGYEPRPSAGINYHVAAHELWLCQKSLVLTEEPTSSPSSIPTDVPTNMPTSTHVQSGDSNYVGPFTPPWNDNPEQITTWNAWCAFEMNEGCYACQNQDGAGKYCQASCAHAGCAVDTNLIVTEAPTSSGPVENALARLSIPNTRSGECAGLAISPAMEITQGGGRPISITELNACLARLGGFSEVQYISTHFGRENWLSAICDAFAPGQTFVRVVDEFGRQCHGGAANQYPDWCHLNGGVEDDWLRTTRCENGCERSVYLGFVCSGTEEMYTGSSEAQIELNTSESNHVGPFTPPWNDSPEITTWDAWCEFEMNESCYACENVNGAGKYCRGFCVDEGCPVPELVSEAPTFVPTSLPTNMPTSLPSFAPSDVPTFAPSETPSDAPTSFPTENPSFEPSEGPTSVPTENPSFDPSEAPTSVPTENPSLDPSEDPTSMPTERLSVGPSEDPTVMPTENPSFDPSESPTDIPSFFPSESPTSVPSEVPPRVQSGAPTSVPTESLVFIPAKETDSPSQATSAETAESDTLLLGVHVSRSDMIYYLIFLVLLVAMLCLCVIACRCKEKSTIVIQKEWMSDSVIRDHTAIDVTNFNEDAILGTYLAATNPLYDSPKHISPNAGPLKMPTRPPSPMEGETKRTPGSPNSPNADFLEGTWSSNVVSDDNGALWYCPDSPSAKRVPEALKAQTSFEDLYGPPEPTLGEVVSAMEESIYRHVSAEGVQDTTTN